MPTTMTYLCAMGYHIHTHIHMYYRAMIDTDIMIRLYERNREKKHVFVYAYIINKVGIGIFSMNWFCGSLAWMLHLFALNHQIVYTRLHGKFLFHFKLWPFHTKNESNLFIWILCVMLYTLSFSLHWVTRAPHKNINHVHVHTCTYVYDIFYTYNNDNKWKVKRRRKKFNKITCFSRS